DQASLLRIRRLHRWIHERRSRGPRVRDRRVDIRQVAASNRDLRKLVREERFRGDLYYRLAVFPIRIPPLRERIEDVPAIARDITRRIGAEMDRPIELTPAALRALQSHSWPGNIRELKNVLERGVLLSEDTVIDSGDLALESEAFADGRAPNVTLREMEKLHIFRVLEEEDGRVTRAAARLGIPRSSLYQKIRKLGTTRGSGAPVPAKG
ncbi:MAG: helix-turn-helix domain-containing protein, partial [Vicinamibacteria bacterium]